MPEPCLLQLRQRQLATSIEIGGAPLAACRVRWTVRAARPYTFHDFLRLREVPAVFKAALVGAAVTLGCILIPIVHFVTAVPSPLIGGYMAGTRSACTQGQALLIGLLMAVLLLLPAAVAVMGVALFAQLSAGFVLVVVGAAVLWVFAGGTVGAALGGASARRSASA